MTLRIIAGEKRGANLSTPKGLATRPTLARIRKSLFMILDEDLEEARVLDAFAGSGALGLEALSRGASHATFIENHHPALEALRANIRKLGWTERARVAAHDALVSLKWPTPPGEQPFTLIFLDPPYGRELAHKALELLATHHAGWVAPGAVVAVQHGKADPLLELYGPLRLVRLEHYSETHIAFYRPQD